MLSRLDHRVGIFPTIPKVLVIEDRNNLTAFAKHADNFIKESSARIHLLVGIGRSRIIAMFSDAENTGHLKLTASQCQSVANRGRDSETVLRGLFTAHVLRGDLISEDRHHLQVWSWPAILLISLKDLADNDIRMAARSVHRHNSRDRQFASRPALLVRKEREWLWNCRCHSPGEAG